MPDMQDYAEQIFHSHGGQIRMSEAIGLGMTRHALYSLMDKGILEKVSRGVYRLAELPPITNPDLVTVSLRIPKAVICLVSALAYHEMTTQIPHEVTVAIPSHARKPKLDFPPLHSYKFSDAAYASGVEVHHMDGVDVRIYSPEKTLADCFKFRNRIGMDVVLESLRFYRERKRLNVGELLKQAEVCRMDRVMRPYLEAML
jgi:predicted transcriptional regulator of viral defense system